MFLREILKLVVVEIDHRIEIDFCKIFEVFLKLRLGLFQFSFIEQMGLRSDSD